MTRFDVLHIRIVPDSAMPGPTGALQHDWAGLIAIAVALSVASALVWPLRRRPGAGSGSRDG